MKTNKTDSSTTNTNVELSSSKPIALSQNITVELENILLRMIYRISQENTHVVNNVGSAA